MLAAEQSDGRDAGYQPQGVLEMTGQQRTQRQNGLRGRPGLRRRERAALGGRDGEQNHGPQQRRARRRGMRNVLMRHPSPANVGKLKRGANAARIIRPNRISVDLILPCYC